MSNSTVTSLPSSAPALIPRRPPLGPTAALALALVCVACAPEPARFVEARLLTMGTWAEVVFEPGNADPDVLLGEVEALLGRLARDYYPWAEGELAALNRSLRTGAGLAVSDGLADLLRDAQRLSADSKGAFEPGVAALVELWGFHSGAAEPTAPPSAEAIREWLAAPSGIAELRIQERMITSESTSVQLDLGGIAKGAATDRVLELLARHGVRNAMVNLGGDLRVMGRRGDRPWRIGIRHPRGPGVLGVIELEDGEAAFTSGDYERYFEHEGRRSHHILDPRTGRPVEHTQAMTVIANDGVTADAASTALFVAGAERWRQTAERLGIRAALRVDASGAMETTAPMSRRLARGDETR